MYPDVMFCMAATSLHNLTETSPRKSTNLCSMYALKAFRIICVCYLNAHTKPSNDGPAASNYKVVLCVLRFSGHERQPHSALLHDGTSHVAICPPFLIHFSWPCVLKGYSVSKSIVPWAKIFVVSSPGATGF